MRKVPETQHGSKIGMEPPKPPASGPQENAVDTTLDVPAGAHHHDPKYALGDNDEVPEEVGDGPAEFSTESKATAEESPLEGDALDDFRDSEERRG